MKLPGCLTDWWYLVSIYSEVIGSFSHEMSTIYYNSRTCFFFFFFTQCCFTMMTWSRYQNGTETRQPLHWYRQSSTRVCLCFCVIAVLATWNIHCRGSYTDLIRCGHVIIILFFFKPWSNKILDISRLLSVLFALFVWCLLPFYLDKSFFPADKTQRICVKIDL